MRNGSNRADENKAIRQTAIREQLSSGKHIQHVIEISSKLLKLSDELNNLEVTRLKHAADLKLKLIDKYLPSLQSVESKVETVDKRMSELTDDELRNIAAGSSKGSSSKTNGKTKIH